MTVLVISNVATTRARRQCPALAEALEGHPGLRHHRTERASALQPLVGHGQWQADDLLVINGGDGTVQHALSLLLAHCPAERWPRVACLPGGSTNMTAFDVNRHRDFRRCLDTLAAGLRHPTADTPRALYETPRALHETPRALYETPRALVAVRGADGPARCGLFFGIGTIVQGIEYFQRRLKSNGNGHELAAGVALARTLWGIGRRQPPFDSTLVARIAAPGMGLDPDTPVSVRLLFATTLERLFLGIRPYWDDREGPLRTTLVERRAGALMRRMPRLLRGRPDPGMTPEGGYHSRGLSGFSLTFRGSYTLDGELFAAGGDRAETIDVRPTDALRFVPL